MTQAYGEMRGSKPHREIIKSPVVSISQTFRLDLVHNDVPVTLYYKHKNNSWKTVLINNEFTPEAVPRMSDIYLSASLNNRERIVFSIDY